ncbi:MAG: glycerol-3-phosphate 1-O-acyltransferase PlsY [Bacteroidales bacterium]|jgi:glycerol-3-phosphate acyltransferase PlsY|nr:glycerol-3-phosphate 1-O-acyltransferase PlsY [Bacteroidales bacterium]
MSILPILFATLVAYLLGSIPSAVWIGKAFFNTDVRQHGSGNAGATNTFRVLGKKAGIPVFIIDVCKAFLATNLIWFFRHHPEGNTYVNLQLLFGAAAVVGHIYPIFANFKGGKGVACLLGVTIAIAPLPALLSFVVFAVVLALFHYVSLASLCAGLAFPIIIISNITSHYSYQLSLQLFSIVVAALLIFTHRKNIQRLLNHEESKTYLLCKHSH